MESKEPARLVWVYVTTGNRAEALDIGQKMVESRLAACANILGGATSIYWWQDRIHIEDEVVLILKTREALLPELIEAVKSLHSYECPCVIALPILGGNPDYMEWLVNETVR